MLLSFLLLFTCACVCRIVQLWLIVQCVFSERSASMSSESRCHDWFDHHNKAATGPFSPLNPSHSDGPGNTSTTNNRRGTIIGVDMLNKKSLCYASDFLFGSYSEACRESKHTKLMFGVYRFDKELGALLNEYDAIRVSKWQRQKHTFLESRQTFWL